MHTPSHIRLAFEHACADEIDALKPGNVHRFADGHRMTVSDFLTSAKVSARPLSDNSLTVGRKILEAVKATRAAVNTNTNLGILLLCAPVASAAESGTANPRGGIAKVLNGLTMDDAAAVFEAIALANPGGLGDGGDNDVREPPRVPLLAAMRQSANRDRIAYQYANDYADIFGIGLPALQHAVATGQNGMWPAIATYFAFLTAFPDSHVARKFGILLAESIRKEAHIIFSRLSDSRDEQAKIGVLMDFDQSLKQRDINPGTSADLTVCCLFVHRLTERLA